MMPVRPTWKVLTTPKSVTIQSEIMDDMPTPIQNPAPLGTPVSVQGGAWLKLIEMMEHRCYLPLHSLLPNHSHWCQEFCLLHHQERMGRMWTEEVH